jgi:hypothetical protein
MMAVTRPVDLSRRLGIKLESRYLPRIGGKLLVRPDQSFPHKTFGMRNSQRSDRSAYLQDGFRLTLLVEDQREILSWHDSEWDAE